jgi:hypothetical protein
MVQALCIRTYHLKVYVDSTLAIAIASVKQFGNEQKAIDLTYCSPSQVASEDTFDGHNMIHSSSDLC